MTLADEFILLVGWEAAHRPKKQSITNRPHARVTERSYINAYVITRVEEENVLKGMEFGCTSRSIPQNFESQIMERNGQKLT